MTELKPLSEAPKDGTEIEIIGNNIQEFIKYDVEDKCWRGAYNNHMMSFSIRQAKGWRPVIK